MKINIVITIVVSCMAGIKCALIVCVIVDRSTMMYIFQCLKIIKTKQLKQTRMKDELFI